MKKSLLIFLFLSSLTWAGLLNAVAFTVNGEPVTLYDIDRIKQQQKLTQEQASLELLKKAITKEMAHEKNIVVEKSMITTYIKGIMEKNNLDRKAFEQNLQIEGLSYDEYFDQIYLQHVQQRLIGMLTYQKVTTPTEKEKRNFFEQHASEFSMPKSISVTQYSSANQKSLQNKQRSPMFFPKDIKQKESVIIPSKVNPKLASLLLKTKKNSYTNIVQTSANSFMMFYIKSFGKAEVPNFNAVEKQIEQTMMATRKNTLINNIFQDAMRKAAVTYIKIKPLNL